MTYLEGMLLKLRKPEEEDMESISRWLLDREFLANLYGSPLRTSVELVREVQSMLNENAKDFSQNITLVGEVKKKSVIGILMFNNINWKNRTAELNVAIGEPQFRNGIYGSEFYLLALLYGFHELNLFKIFGYAYDHSHSAMRINGFAGKTEGVLREHIYRNGKYVNMTIFSIFRDDFEVFLQDHKSRELRRYFQRGLITEVSARA